MIAGVCKCGAIAWRPCVEWPSWKPAEPRDGDLTLCLSCGRALITTARLMLRPATILEIQAQPPCVRAHLYAAHEGVRWTHARRPRTGVGGALN